MPTLRRLHELLHLGTDHYGAHVKGRPILLASEGTTSTHVIFNSNSPAIHIIDAWGVMVGNGDEGDTWAIRLGGVVFVSNLVSVAAATDKQIVRVGELNSVTSAVAAGQTVEVTRSGDAPVDVYILAFMT